ncbi:bifunctional riboflavin kinase/FAD synthetase [Aminicella lysinilytica]|uniref:Riboflavin biosynthesis protein n=1 Tax=Aminicella lysinilytica TaxID=433323 RepID=A0A4R6QE15_9FIRM|nr:bifunctional riboflavin kinase/FAD synthetase [Aminicella lysinilytica]TDP59679.1 FMN adenylyltransferase /riboflavin kinase [Aminicella lysinilytica]
MKIFTELYQIEEMEPTAVALGNFDGVHLGHQRLIKEAVDYAARNGVKSAVFTFSNHPKDLLPKAKKVKNILYKNEKTEIIASLGVDYLFEIPFTKAIMTMDPVYFIDHILLNRFNMKAAFCGFNYRFGLEAAGNPDVLRNVGTDRGFEVFEMDPYKIKGNIVSSSLIRTLVASGQVEQCKTYMGRNYEIGGEVVVGNRLGRKLGFPTSNLVIDTSMVTPPNGVYVTFCDYNGVRYPSVTNVGNKPTIGHYNKNVETHIFDFDKELYGKKIIVEFLKKTRDEVQFDNVKDLSEQIVRDCREAKIYHEKLAEAEKE